MRFLLYIKYSMYMLSCCGELSIPFPSPYFMWYKWLTMFGWGFSVTHWAKWVIYSVTSAFLPIFLSCFYKFLLVLTSSQEGIQLKKHNRDLDSEYPNYSIPCFGYGFETNGPKCNPTLLVIAWHHWESYTINMNLFINIPNEKSKTIASTLLSPPKSAVPLIFFSNIWDI